MAYVQAQVHHKLPLVVKQDLKVSSVPCPRSQTKRWIWHDPKEVVFWWIIMVYTASTWPSERLVLSRSRNGQQIGSYPIIQGDVENHQHVDTTVPPCGNISSPPPLTIEWLTMIKSRKPLIEVIVLHYWPKQPFENGRVFCSTTYRSYGQSAPIHFAKHRTPVVNFP